ncbi:hypothetical protein NB498_20910, partial [Vibrio alginolyticus]|nr:hypothetical protein [Vibrio alginolyticus]MCR9504927.1 hypothetical protein [Vibrio alginolyticus]
MVDIRRKLLKRKALAGAVYHFLWVTSTMNSLIAMFRKIYGYSSARYLQMPCRRMCLPAEGKMKTKIIMSFLLATLCVSVSASTNEPKYHSALTVKTGFSEDRDKPVEVYYWYPTTNEKNNFSFGRGNIFKSVETQLDAPLASGKFPVVLLSQGGTRSAFSHSGWIASSLAQQGYVVVVPKPPAPNE